MEHSKAIKVPVLLTFQMSADTIVRFANIKGGGEVLKTVSDNKLLERELMVYNKCHRKYTCLPKDGTVRCLKFHIKKANTKYQVFVTISACNNFLNVFWVKSSSLPKHNF